MPMSKQLVLACDGKSVSQGGLNAEKLKEELSALFPNEEHKIRSMTRKSLLVYCKRTPVINKEIRTSKEKYFRPGSPLNSRQQAYCRCIAHVSAQKSAQNPYAICTKSTKRTGRFKCAPYYNYSNIPDHEVKGLAKLKGKSVSDLKSVSDQEYKRSPRNPYY